MRLRCTVGVILLNAGMFAQSTPSRCPADRPVDDIIAEVSKQQAKNRRNPNPLPDVICIWGWCREHRPGTPPPVPEPVPRAEIPTSSDDGSSSGSVSAISASACDDAVESALKAAKDVEVGDYYFFEKKNYKGALLRYDLAAKEKPRDAAIHVRLGRVFEKLDKPEQAIEQYKAAQKLEGPKRWSDEAGDALKRLQQPKAHDY